MTALATSADGLFGGRYQLVRRIAVGGMAEIYLARQIASGGSGAFDKDVVIKRLRPDLLDDARISDMFLDEAQICALLVHPHTVHVYDVGVHDGVPFIAMEYIRGEELNELCRRGLAAGAFLPRALAVELIRQAALSLGHFHSLRDSAGLELEIVHCDISPTNLLVTRDGFVKVIDFGIARFRGQRYRDQAAVPGKLSYMSPEQARREPLDFRSDIYSLGVVLYEITVGRRLFKGPANEVIKRLAAGDVKPPTFVRNDYPGPLESIVMRALEPNPIDRYQSAFDLADELHQYVLEAAGTGAGPVAIARYLDQLEVASGGQRRPELIREDELAEDDALDFDRVGWIAESGAGAVASVAEWDEFEEDEQAVADALGIDVSLVRTQGHRPGTEEALIDGGDATPAPEPAPSPSPAAPSPPQQRSSTPPVADAPGPRTSHKRSDHPSISPLPPPSPTGPLLLGIGIGAAIAFLVLHFLM